VATEAANIPAKLPAKLFPADDFVAAANAKAAGDALLYFLMNIGDGDAQLIVLPRRKDGTRRAVVVDVGATGKLPELIEALAAAEILKPFADPKDPYLFPLVVATHPHNDHNAGLPEFIDRFKDNIRELWEPGYYHPNAGYIEMMRALEEADGQIQHTQPTSGTTRYIGRVRFQVLAPSIAIRNRFDSYGINLNNASLALKVEFPASGVEWSGKDREYVRLSDKRRRLLLGADSQTLSWGKVLDDFPTLESTNFPANRALGIGRGTEPLRAEVFKVPHHGSKHGVNIELVEEIRPAWSLISSVAGGGEYNFPHVLAQEAVREALEPVSSTGALHKPDWKLGIHYTGAVDDQDVTLGTIALVIPPTGKITMWRFGDLARDEIDFARARRYSP
jgi:hypothetical protein